MIKGMEFWLIVAPIIILIWFLVKMGPKLFKKWQVENPSPPPKAVTPTTKDKPSDDHQKGGDHNKPHSDGHGSHGHGDHDSMKNVVMGVFGVLGVLAISGCVLQNAARETPKTVDCFLNSKYCDGSNPVQNPDVQEASGPNPEDLAGKEIPILVSNEVWTELSKPPGLIVKYIKGSGKEIFIDKTILRSCVKPTETQEPSMDPEFCSKNSSYWFKAEGSPEPKILNITWATQQDPTFR